MKVEIFKGQFYGEWYWHTVADNGNVTQVGGEGYKNRLDCLEMAVKSNVGNYVVHQVEQMADGTTIREVVVEVRAPEVVLLWKQEGNWRVAEYAPAPTACDHDFADMTGKCAQCGEQVR